MRVTLGFDTSCYTTSAAAVDEHGTVVAAERMLLPVREGQRGLRQSEAVFAHVRQMPQVMEALSRLLAGARASSPCAPPRVRATGRTAICRYSPWGWAMPLCWPPRWGCRCMKPRTSRGTLPRG